MIITPMQLYFITRLDDVKTSLQTLAILLLMAGVVSVIGGVVYAAENEKEKFPKWVLLVPLAAFLSAAVSVFIPTTKQMAAIYVIPTIVNNKKVQEIPSKLLTLADEWMDELRPKSK